MVSSLLERPLATRIDRAWWRRLASRLVVALPTARALHVGAEEAALVEELLARGVDTYGLYRSDAAPVSCAAADRFRAAASAEVSRLPATYSTVICSLSAADSSDTLRRLPSALVPWRPRHVLVLLHDCEPGAPLAAREPPLRAAMRAAGFRRHPAEGRFRPYDARPDEARTLTLVFESIPEWTPDHATRHGTESATDDLLLDDTAAAEDAIARFTLAAAWIQRQDLVIDLDSGSGAGAAILYDASSCARLLALDPRPAHTTYARATYAPHRPYLEFLQARLGSDDGLPAQAADIVVALRSPVDADDAQLRQAVDLLAPGGRLIVAVRPTGRDTPAQSATLERLREHLHVEALFAQMTSDGGDGRTRRGLIRLTGPGDPDAIDAHCWILVCLKDPLRHDAPPPQRLDHPRAHDRTLDIAALSAGFDDPWTPYAVQLRNRATHPDVLVDVARRLLDRYPQYSADRGAALCMLAYRRLEGQDSAALRDLPLESWLSTFAEGIPRSPVEVRWSISNSYVLGRLLVRAGRLDEAERMFTRCEHLASAAQEALTVSRTSYIALTATKTVDAAFQAGWLASRRGDRLAARDHWRAGLEIARRAVSEGWALFTGPRVISAAYGVREASQILEAAARCEKGLAWLDLDDARLTDLAPLTLSSPAEGEAPSSLDSARNLRRHRFARPSPDADHAALILNSARGRRIYVWGAGSLGQQFAALAGPRFAQVTGFIDSQPARHQARVADKPIVGPSVLDRVEDTSGAARPFVIVTSSFWDTIVPELERRGYTLPDDFYIFRPSL